MRRAACALVFSLALAWAASADSVFLRTGVVHDGKVMAQDDEGVTINTFNSTMHEMIWGVKKLAKNFVEKVEITPEDPLREYWFDASDPKPDHLALMKFCRANSFPVEAREEALEVLAADPANAEARAEIGADVDAVLKASPRHNKDIDAVTADWTSLDQAGRAAAYARLRKDFGVTLPPEYFDRIARSRALPKGVVVEDRHLTWNTRNTSGVYSVWVPKDYNPHKAYPLLLTLHGTWNGLGGIGEGHTFIRHFTYAETKKWDVIIVSPTANPRPWTARGDDFVLSVIKEAELLYNVDMNRIYVTGHSMGGGGTWHFGTKYAERFAAFAPAAAAGSGDELHAAEMGTGMYIYHSSDDPSASCERDRIAARRLRDAKADFVYTEWTDQQHGWPQAVIADSFLYFRHHHRMNRGPSKPVPIHGTRSSFAEPAWPSEALYFPAPRAEGRKGEMEDLVGEIQLGGVVAEKAADRLLVMKDKRAIPFLAAIVVDAKDQVEEARMEAARALGAIQDLSAAGALLKAMADPSLRVRRAAADALALAGSQADAIPLASASSPSARNSTSSRRTGSRTRRGPRSTPSTLPSSRPSAHSAIPEPGPRWTRSRSGKSC
ncbi:MAG: HEAT repeat domain-containing protein [Planctomycetes bacterium]|nr:HEAT repeat domain-containing protein [Planctomycetota bacterium]